MAFFVSCFYWATCRITSLIIFLLVHFTLFVFILVIAYPSPLLINHLPWAYVQTLLRDAASTFPVGSAKTSMFWKLAAAFTPALVSR